MNKERKLERIKVRDQARKKTNNNKNNNLWYPLPTTTNIYPQLLQTPIKIRRRRIRRNSIKLKCFKSNNHLKYKRKNITHKRIHIHETKNK